MNVSTSYSAYVPGQKIHFHVVLDNQSDVQCMDVKVRLFKNVSYRGKGDEKEQTKTTEARVADKHCGEVDKHNKAQFDEYLIVPPTTPTTLSERDAIRVSYTLRFIAKTFRLHGGGDIVVDFPLIIGTVPLFGSVEDKGPLQNSQENKVNGKIQQLCKCLIEFTYVCALLQCSSIFIFAAAPNFQEDVSSEHFEANTFKPRYPVFIFDGQLAGNGNEGNAPVPSLYPKTDNTPGAVPIQYTPNPVSPNGKDSASAVQKTPPYPTQAPASGNNFEVLGFSIPPGYEPTPSAPTDAPIGWK